MVLCLWRVLRLTNPSNLFARAVLWDERLIAFRAWRRPANRLWMWIFVGALTVAMRSKDRMLWSVKIPTFCADNTSVVVTLCGLLEIIRSKTLFSRIGNLFVWVRKWSLSRSTKRSSLTPLEFHGESLGILGKLKSHKISVKDIEQRTAFFVD